MVTLEEINTLLGDLESDRVERKASASDRSRIRRTICAFANDLPGHGRPGVIFVGLNDDGTCSDLEITDELLLLLSNMRSAGDILPVPTMTVQKHTLQECDLAVVCVSPSDMPPVRYQGRTWVRVGPRLDMATPEDERRLSERRRAADIPFDHRPVGETSMGDLDLDFFERSYLTQAVALDVLEQNARPVNQQLASLRFVTAAGVPNIAAVLFLSSDPRPWVPGAYVQFLRVEGEELTDPIQDEKTIGGPVHEMLARLDESLEINISTSVDAVSSVKEIRQPDYPVAALQQLVRNAVMHRSYENTNAPVKVYWFSDRIEITNPGGLYGHVTAANFGSGVTDYRNPLIAEGMKVLGFVQRFGLGIPLVKKALADNGNPEAEFHFEPEYVQVTVRKRQ